MYGISFLKKQRKTKKVFQSLMKLGETKTESETLNAQNLIKLSVLYGGRIKKLRIRISEGMYPI